jgi:asparagine synthase (glutamine-hydrolysing)
MASSVELRLPLVDYRLVDTVIGLQKMQPDHGLPPKQRLRAALKQVLPDWVMNRTKKGFTPPVHLWHEALFAIYGEQLKSGFLVQSGILTPEAGGQLSQGPFLHGEIGSFSFKALVLEIWCRQMLSHTGKREFSQVPSGRDTFLA